MMDVNEIVMGYITYLKTLPEAKYYSYFHSNSYAGKTSTLMSYMKSLDLSFTDFKKINEQLTELDDYLQMHLIIPKKKKPIKKKRQSSTDSE